MRLNSVVPDGAGIVAAKVEYLNPGGSSKDRIAVKMIDAAEASGQLRPGGTIVEPTSGNTGVGLALVAQHRGYKCVFVCPDKVSEDKRNVLRAYGAEVVVCPTAVPPEDPDSYYSVSDRLVARSTARGSPTSTPTRRTRPATTRPPARRSGPTPTAGSPISSPASAPAGRSPAPAATSRRCPAAAVQHRSAPTRRARCTRAAPAGRIWSRASARTSGRTPTTRAVPDEIIAVSDSDSFDMTRRLAREEAMLVGGSCGMAVVGRAEGRRRGRARRAGGGAAARRRARLHVEDLHRRAGWRPTGSCAAADGETRPRSARCCAASAAQLPDLVHTHP